MGISFQAHHHVSGGHGTAPKPNALDSSPTEPHCYSNQSLLCLSGEVLKNIMGAVKGKSVLLVSGLKRDPHALLDLFKLFLGHNTISIPSAEPCHYYKDIEL